jgi:hypothetical protein
VPSTAHGAGILVFTGAVAFNFFGLWQRSHPFVRQAS